MKIKIINIKQQLPDIQGNNKTTGKSYTVRHWNCDVEVNGQVVTSEIKSFDTSLFLEANKEYEAEAKTFNNTTSYQIVKEKTGGGFSRIPKVTYSLKEYNDLFLHSLKKCSIDVAFLSEENRCKIFATYFIGIKDCGIKI